MFKAYMVTQPGGGVLSPSKTEISVNEPKRWEFPMEEKRQCGEAYRPRTDDRPLMLYHTLTVRLKWKSRLRPLRP